MPTIFHFSAHKIFVLYETQLIEDKNLTKEKRKKMSHEIVRKRDQIAKECRKDRILEVKVIVTKNS